MILPCLAGPRHRAGLLLLLSGCSPFALSPALAATSAAATPAADDIVVTGQAPPGAVIGDIPAENQLNRADIDAYGVGTISELLDEIASQTQSNQGRSDDGPVVLVNGKRISGVNEVNDLPTEAILRLDILPEEVALKYGYDAQRKVVNIILHRRFRSQVANLSGGFDTAGQGENAAGDFGYTRIRDNDRINITARAKSTASLLESERDIVSTDTSIDPTGQVDNVGRYRTLSPSTRTYMLNANVAHQLADKVNMSWNGRVNYSTSAALNGLPTGSLTTMSDGSSEPIDRILSTDPLRQDSRTLSLSSGVSLNAELSKTWRLSLIGSYSHSDVQTDSDTGYDLTALQATLDAGEDIDANGVLPSSLLGRMQTRRSSALSDSGSASLLVNGKLLKLPAGNMGVSLRFSGDTSSLRSTSEEDSITTTRTARRTTGGTQISIDVPIASRRNGFLSPLGTLTANANASVTHYSDYGALATLGYGLSWTPRTGITFIAAINNDRSAPTLSDRNDPTITTSNVRIYDYVTGNTATVTQVSGGNPDLKADNRHQLKLGATVKPWSKLNLSLSANYVSSRTRNAIVSLSGTSVALEEAFPDRYERDDEGNLVRINTQPVNVAREDVDQFRWGINFTTVLRAPKRPAPPAGFVPPNWAKRATSQDEPAPQAGAATESGPDTAAPESGEQEHGPQDEADILVTGQRGDDATPMGPRGGFGGPDGFGGPPPGPPPDGMGPPPGGGPPGGMGGGPGGMGPPPGGPGGPGGGGSDNGARLQFSLYHSAILRDAILLREGTSWIDLLDGGTLGGTAQSRHSVQFSSGVIDNGVGLRLDSNWKSSATVTADQNSAGSDLHFGSLLTFDLRLFANLSNRIHNQNWARGMRVSLSVQNILNTLQKVTDGSGATPTAYQGAYLDPDGRTVMLSIRKML